MRHEQFASAEVWWAAVGTLDRAAEYLATDAGERDIYWTADLDEAVKIIQHHADKLRTRCVKLERG